MKKHEKTWQPWMRLFDLRASQHSYGATAKHRCTTLPLGDTQIYREYKELLEADSASR
jgi:hypothetical protein